MQYAVQGQRADSSGPLSPIFTVNFGRLPGGGMTASVMSDHRRDAGATQSTEDGQPVQKGVAGRQWEHNAAVARVDAISWLKINRDKSAVARPGERRFLGYSVTVHQGSRLKIAPASVQRFKKKLRPLPRRGRGRNLRGLPAELAPILCGWAAYFRLSEVKVTWETLDPWLRRKPRAILWKPWKTWRTRLRKLTQLGLVRDRAAASALNGRGAWWNAGASHMNEAVPNAPLQRWGLVSLQQEQRRLARDV